MTYPIADAAARCGLTIDTLRYYERTGLVEPVQRDTAGRRRYSEADLHWLGFLTKLRLTGMPIRVVREYAALRRLGPAGASRRKAILQRQRGEVAARIAELQECLTVLDRKITNYERTDANALRHAPEANTEKASA